MKRRGKKREDGGKWGKGKERYFKASKKTIRLPEKGRGEKMAKIRDKEKEGQEKKLKGREEKGKERELEERIDKWRQEIGN